MAGLTDLSRDLGNIAKQNGRKGVSSWMSRLYKGFGTTDNYTTSLSLAMMPITVYVCSYIKHTICTQRYRVT